MTVALVIPQQGLVGASAQTAGTTQTSAGSTQVNAQVVTVTTGNASDGMRLPAGSPGQVVWLIHGATAAKLYPPTGGTINGGAADASVVPTASKTTMVVYTSEIDVRTAAFA